MELKNKPNHQKYLCVLQMMTAEQKLMKVFELSEMTKNLFYAGLKDRFPEKSEPEIKKLYLERLEKCHNRNY